MTPIKQAVLVVLSFGVIFYSLLMAVMAAVNWFHGYGFIWVF